MIEGVEASKIGLSPEGQERRVRMLIELRGAMSRRVARRRALRRGGSAAAFLLAAGAVWGAVVVSRSPVPPARTLTSNSIPTAPVVKTTPVESMPRLTNVTMVIVSGNSNGVSVQGTDPMRVAKYVAAPSKRPSAEVISDAALMQALSRTGNDYGLVRVGERVDVRCYSCDNGLDDTPPVEADTWEPPFQEP